jgi:DNA (cytosine-5)-methyltransferase 1
MEVHMRGGVRKNAGRNKISPDKKKITKSIHVSPKLFEQIQSLEIKGYESFSSKCQHLIEKGYKTIMEIENKASSKLTFIDLFAGIGGIRQGFEDQNTKCVFSSEWDKFSAKTYEANYGEAPYGDITQINEKDIPKHDVLLAGFPCQPFSNIGKRQGFGHETQGTLFFDVLRILRYHMPKMFLLENVPGLLTIQKGETFRVILENLEDLGYTVFYDVLDAQNFGLPQVRKRVVIVGFHPDLNISSFAFPQGSNEVRVPVSSILEKKPKGYDISEHLQQSYLFKKDDGKPQVIDNTSDIQVKTLVASYHKIQRLTGTFIKEGDTGLRLFSELECKRLMGFPDDFLIPVSRTQMYRQMGNSVAVPMIKEVADAMKEELFMALKLDGKKELRENYA